MIDNYIKKNTLSKKINKKRKQLKMTLNDLAKEIGSSKSYIWELENNDKINPSGKTILKLSKALNVTTDYLLDDNILD